MNAYQVLTVLVITFFTAMVLQKLNARRKNGSLSIPGKLETQESNTKPNPLIQSLHATFSDRTLIPSSPGFDLSQKIHWAAQEASITPGIVFRPESTSELCEAVKLIKTEFDLHTHDHQKTEGLFAIRSGGRSPVAYAASIENGVLIDLSGFKEVSLGDGHVVVGSGARWSDVERALDGSGRGVPGGRNGSVGVGGLSLGGGISFHSSCYGFVCNNILSYEIVLSSGKLVTASATSNPDLWKALKGGGNNFGIVTRFTFRTFPSTGKIWSGFLYMPSYQADKVVKMFHDFVKKEATEEAYDRNAAGPMACFSYAQPIRMHVVSVNLVHTDPPIDGPGKLIGKEWPRCWKETGFNELWRFWSTMKVQTVKSAIDEMEGLNPPGRRQIFVTTTIKNDLETLRAVHSLYLESAKKVREVGITGCVWTMVIQPLLPEWARRGDPNPLGLESETTPLVIVEFNINWHLEKHDTFVHSTLKDTIHRMDLEGEKRGTAHRYRYMNYCAGWQKPFDGYGGDNWEFLKRVAREYDRDGVFQKGCVGGFKLDMES